MNVRIGFAGVMSTLALVCWSQSSIAQGNCGDLVLTGETGQRFPNARRACLDIVERDGQQYAHFIARITRVQGSAVEAEIKLPDGTYTQPIRFEPEESARVRIEGRSYRYRDLSRGQELDLYVPPSRWAIAVYESEADFATAPAVTLVALEEPTPVVASLPRTASALPLIGLLGALFTGLGFVVARVRRKLGA